MDAQSNESLKSTSKHNSVLIVALVFSVTLLSLFVVETNFGFTVRVVDAVWLYLLFLFVIKLSITKKFKVIPMPSLLFCFFWIYYGSLILLPYWGLMVNNVPFQLLSSSFRAFMFATLVYILYHSISSKKSLDKSFEAAVIISIIINFIYAIFQQLEFQSVIDYGSLPHHLLEPYIDNTKFHHFGRATGFFFNPNQLGWFGACATIYFYVSYIVLVSRKYLFYSLFSFSLILLANSRTALFSVIASIILLYLLFAIYYKKKKVISKNMIFIIIIVLFLLLVINAAIFDYTLQGLRIFTEGPQAVSALGHRINTYWSRGFFMFEQFPWGYGGDPKYYIGNIDSGWLWYLAQGSLFLPIAFALFLLFTSMFGLKCFKLNKSRYGLSLIGICIALAIGHITLAPIHDPVVSVFFLFCIMLTVIDHRR